MVMRSSPVGLLCLMITTLSALDELCTIGQHFCFYLSDLDEVIERFIPLEKKSLHDKNTRNVIFLMTKLIHYLKCVCICVFCVCLYICVCLCVCLCMMCVGV